MSPDETSKGLIYQTLESNIGAHSICMYPLLSITQDINTFSSLPVPGLMENRPSVLIGDEILVQPAGAAEGGKWFSGFVHTIERDEVGLRFGGGFQGFNLNERFYVRFKYNRTVSRRQHHAIKATPPVPRLQFPLLTDVKPKMTLQGDIVTYNQDIETNPAQKRAVSSIVRLPPGSPPFIVFGP
jgi:helicase MOV-10